MPVYEYKCKECGRVEFVNCPIAERKDVIACVCGRVMKQVFGTPGISWNTPGKTVNTTPRGK